MTPKEIEKLIEDLTLAYASGEEGENGWLIKGKANKEKAELIVRKHYEESKNKNELLELKAELSIYREIVSKSNFCQMVIKEKEIIEPEPYQRDINLNKSIRCCFKNNLTNCFAYLLGKLSHNVSQLHVCCVKTQKHLSV